MRPSVAAAVLLLASTASASGQAPGPSPAAAGVARSLRVPLDHTRPAAGSATLLYELGAPFDARKPTVVVVADGQQFYLQPGATASLQARLFGDAFNVVAILGRGAGEEFQAAARDATGEVDWYRAWQVFRAEQWLEDIDSVRRALLGEGGKVHLYGGSGGADLAHLYLQRHGENVGRAFTESAGNGRIERQLRLGEIGSWSDFAAKHPTAMATLEGALARRPEERLRVLVALQRQHFFVPAAGLEAARLRLIERLAAGDDAALAAAAEEYQVDAILDLLRSPRGLAVVVREFEFLAALGESGPGGDGRLRPPLEVRRAMTAPLVELWKAGRVGPPPFDLAAVHDLSAEVFLLTARWDEAIDYRVSIALAYSYPRHELFIADDNHLFERARGDLKRRLVETFLAFGLGSPQLEALMAELESYRWDEARSPVPR